MKTSTLIAAITLSALVPNLTAQEYWDDVYFSSKNRKAVKVVSPKSGSNETVNETDNEIDVDEYNRRYSEPEKSTPDQTTATRQSDTEYTQRILRYHSPEKITIAGADKVELYFSDPSYDTNNAYYSEGYYGSYDPWFYHNPYSLYSWSYPAISYGWYHPWRTHLYYNTWGDWYGWGGWYHHPHHPTHFYPAHTNRPAHTPSRRNTYYSNGRKSNTYNGRNANTNPTIRREAVTSNSREASRSPRTSSPATTTRTSSPSVSSSSFSGGRSSGSSVSSGSYSSGSRSSSSGSSSSGSRSSSSGSSSSGSGSRGRR